MPDETATPSSPAPGAGSSRYAFHVDLLAGDRLEGWSWMPSDPHRHPTVALHVNGMIVGSGPCDIYRPDLEAEGIGDGTYGFRLALPADIDPDGDVVHVVVDQDVAYRIRPDQVARRIRPTSLHDLAPARATGSRLALHVDVTDLVFYWSHQRHISGIQRVALGYAQSLLDARTDDLDVVFVCKTIPGKDYHRLSQQEFRGLIEAFYRPSVTDGDWFALMRGLRDRSRVPLDFPDGAMLLILGAPWVAADYYETVVRLKHRRGVRVVQLIYDLIPVQYPDYCDEAVVSAFGAFLGEALVVADAFLAISQHTRDLLEARMDRLGLPRRPVGIIPMGSELTRPAGGPAENDRLAPAVRQLLGQDYVLFVGTVEVRKNHRFIVEFWRRLIERLGADAVPRLVWVGRRGWLVDDLLRQMTANRWLDGKVVHLPAASDHELDALYRHCRFTVFPSLYEGWGLPVAESLAYGKPCLAARNSAIPEAGGDLATYVDLEDSRAAFDTLLRLVQDRAATDRLARDIVDRFQPLGWAAAARLVVGDLRRIAADPARGGRGVAGFSDGPRTFAADCVPALPTGVLVHLGQPRDRPDEEQGVAQEMRRHLCFGEDWYDPEPWGRWSRGPVLRLLLPAPAERTGPVDLYLTVRLPSWCQRATATVHVDGVARGHVEVAPDKDVRVRVEIAESAIVDAGGSGFFSVEMAVDRQAAKSPSDERDLGLGIGSLFLVPRDDYRARLNYMEHLMGVTQL